MVEKSKTDKKLLQQKRENSLKRRLYLYHINNYLSKLTFLSGKEVYKEDLLTLDFTDSFREKAHDYEKFIKKEFTIPFPQKKEKEFAMYIDRLFESSKQNIYIGISGTQECGLYKFNDIKSVNFDFDFDFEESESITFITVDGKNYLLLDFEIDNMGNHLINIEAQGENWSSVELP